MNVRELSPIFVVLMKSLLFHFKFIKGNTEKIERIMLKKKENEQNYDKKVENKNKQTIHKV